MNFQVSHAGRPLAENVNRDKNGKSRGETTESILAAGLAQRLKQGIPYEMAVVRDERTGDVVAANADTGHLLGQLKMLGRADGISEIQFFTGMSFSNLIFNYARIMGIPSPNPKAMDYHGAKGASLKAPPPEETIIEIRGRYNDCMHLLANADQSQCSGNKIQKIVRLVCQEQITLREINAEEAHLGNLRMGLNVLVPMFRKPV